jgi:cyclopropane fatty-acyl-phospholipid synthase-like methyltransferase
MSFQASIKRLVRRSPRLTRALGKAYSMLSGPFPGSEDYWVKRYAKGGNSGPGSYSELAKFKARVLNAFVVEKNIASVMEFGCGDGNQLELAQYPSYVGFDVSPVAVDMCRKRFASDKTKRFSLLSDYTGEQVDMAMSLDVIYHLVEVSVYEAHLRTVFGAATRFVVIYSTNRDAPDDAGLPHVRHRRFTDFVDRELSGWKLLRNEKQPREYSGDITESSLAEFYLFEKA